MELRNSRFKLPLLPEKKERKRKASDVSSSLSPSPEDTSPRAKRLVSRLKRIDDTRGLPSPLQRKRAERREAEINKRRDDIDIPIEDAVFGHSSFVSARTFSRQLLEAVMKRDENRVRQLCGDSRMPMNAFTTQYSYADARCPLVEAFASENVHLILTLLTERADKQAIGIDKSLLEPVYCNANYGKFYLPTVPSDDSLALKKYAAPDNMKEPLLMQLVRRNVAFSIIEKFRPLSLYLGTDEYDQSDDVGDAMIKKAHEVIGDRDGELYTTDDYGAAAVEALRYGHCILALNLARKSKCFTELTEEIITNPANSKGVFASDGLMYKRSSTIPYFLPIHAAAARGRPDVLEWYHGQYEYALNLKDEEHWTPLHYAAAAENPAALKWIMAKGASHLVTFRNKQGQTPLHVAVEAGRVENVKIIASSLEALDRLRLNSDNLSLDDRTSLNWKNLKEESALFIAAGKGNLEIVATLCRHPYVNVDSRNREGLTPIMIAAACGHLALVEALAKDGERQVDELERDALTHAAINGQTNVVAFLLKMTTWSHDSLDTCQNTALHYACAYGWMSIVRLLVEVDSELLGLSNRKGLTPAVCAYRNGHFGIILWLVANGFGQYVREDPSSNLEIKEAVGEWMAAHYN